jgi:hypothetical protein
MTEDDKKSIYNTVMEELAVYVRNFLAESVTKWTPETIESYLEEHPEITTREQFHTVNPSAYKAACKHGIIDNLFKRQVRKPYTKSEIRNYLKRHPEIETRYQFQKAKQPMFLAAYKFGMLDELFPMRMRPNKVVRTAQQQAEHDINNDLQRKYRNEVNNLYAERYMDKSLEDMWFPSDDEFKYEFFRKDYDVFLKNNKLDTIHNYMADILEKVPTQEEYVEKFLEMAEKRPERYGTAKEAMQKAKDEWTERVKKRYNDIVLLKRGSEEELKNYLLLKYIMAPQMIEHHRKFRGIYADELKFTNDVNQDEALRKLYRKFLVFNNPIDKDVWTIDQFVHIWVIRILKADVNQFSDKYGRASYYSERFDDLRGRYDRK